MNTKNDFEVSAVDKKYSDNPKRRQGRGKRIDKQANKTKPRGDKQNKLLS